MVRVRSGPHQLEIRVIPVSAWILGGVFLLLGLAMLVDRTNHELTCQPVARQIDCVLTHAHALGLRSPEHEELRGLVGASVEKYEDGKTSRVVLATMDGARNLTPLFTGGDHPTRVAERINHAISAQVRFTIEESSHLWVAASMFACLAFPAVLLGFPQARLFMDAATGMVSVTQRRRFLSRTEQISMSSLVELLMVENAGSSGSRYRIELVCRDEVIPLTRYFTHPPPHRAFYAAAAFLSEHARGVRQTNPYG